MSRKTKRPTTGSTTADAPPPLPYITSYGALIEVPERRDKGLSLRVSASEHRRICKAARQSGFRNHTDWARAVVLGSVLRVEQGELIRRRAG